MQWRTWWEFSFVSTTSWKFQWASDTQFPGQDHCTNFHKKNLFCAMNHQFRATSLMVEATTRMRSVFSNTPQLSINNACTPVYEAQQIWYHCSWIDFIVTSKKWPLKSYPTKAAPRLIFFVVSAWKFVLIYYYSLWKRKLWRGVGLQYFFTYINTLLHLVWLLGKWSMRSWVIRIYWRGLQGLSSHQRVASMTVNVSEATFA